MTLQELCSLPPQLFIRSAYLYILGREPDAAGRHYYMGRLAEGHGKRSVLRDLCRSAEGKALLADHPDGSSLLSDAQFVDYVYRRVLGREPDAGGKTYYVGQLQSGVARSEVFEHVRGSEEARSRREAGMDLDGELKKLREEKSAPGWLVKFGVTGRLERRIAQMEFAAEQRYWMLRTTVDALASNAGATQPGAVQPSGQAAAPGAAPLRVLAMSPRDGARPRAWPSAHRSPLAQTFHAYRQS